MDVTLSEMATERRRLLALIKELEQKRAAINRELSDAGRDLTALDDKIWKEASAA